MEKTSTLSGIQKLHGILVPIGIPVVRYLIWGVVVQLVSEYAFLDVRLSFRDVTTVAQCVIHCGECVLTSCEAYGSVIWYKMVLFHSLGCRNVAQSYPEWEFTVLPLVSSRFVLQSCFSIKGCLWFRRISGKRRRSFSGEPGVQFPAGTRLPPRRNSLDDHEKRNENLSTTGLVFAFLDFLIWSHFRSLCASQSLVPLKILVVGVNVHCDNW